MDSFRGIQGGNEKRARAIAEGQRARALADNPDYQALDAEVRGHIQSVANQLLTDNHKDLAEVRFLQGKMEGLQFAGNRLQERLSQMDRALQEEARLNVRQG